jgi:glycosyltransferase involved in cell wall biosynthesis
VPAQAGIISTQVDVLAEGLRRLVEDPAEARAMGQAARRLALGRYGLRRFLADWDELLLEVTA